jgi:hypothetical protein
MTRTAHSAKAWRTSVQDYMEHLHLPLVVVLFLLCIVLGALGFALRPGTDRPPPVSDYRIQLDAFQQRSSAAMQTEAAAASIDEILVQKTATIVEVQIDLFAAFRSAGVVHWQLLTQISGGQPYSCPSPYNYLGTAQPDPALVQNGTLRIGGAAPTAGVIANFVGHRMTKTAADILGLAGQSPRPARANTLAPIAEIDLCWRNDPPLAFDGSYASAALPTVNLYTESNTALRITRSLYFENPLQATQPITGEYSLQAGSLPTSTDPVGWHWSGSPGGLIQLTALNIPVAQHETYLGFISGVLFGIAGGALIGLCQETLEPIRRHRDESTSSRKHKPRQSPHQGGEKME